MHVETRLPRRYRARAAEVAAYSIVDEGSTGSYMYVRSEKRVTCRQQRLQSAPGRLCAHSENEDTSEHPERLAVPSDQSAIVAN